MIAISWVINVSSWWNYWVILALGSCGKKSKSGNEEWHCRNKLSESFWFATTKHKCRHLEGSFCSENSNFWNSVIRRNALVVSEKRLIWFSKERASAVQICLLFGSCRGSDWSAFLENQWTAIAWSVCALKPNDVRCAALVDAAENTFDVAGPGSLTACFNALTSLLSRVRVRCCHFCH